MKVIIVGGVAGGATAAARLRRLDEKAEIIILERSGFVSYANCGLPYYIGGVILSKEDLTLQTPQSFKNRFNIDVRIKNEVIKINPDEKTVDVTDLETGRIYKESYDKLILSPGAKSIVADVPVEDKSKIMTLRTVEDTYSIYEYMRDKKPKNAVIVGGGFIGLEMAENLLEKGLRTTLIQLSDHVMPTLDYDMACQVHSYLREKGLDLRLNQIKPDQEIFDNADIVIMSVGVLPETDIAKEAGLQLGIKGAIVVNDYMETSKKDIYAVGDAVEVKNYIGGEKTVIPLAGPANKQGRIVADNICGIKSKYKGSQGSSVIKLFDMTVATTGLNEKTAKTLGIKYDKVINFSASHATYYPGATNMTIKTLFDPDTGKILGAQIIGFTGVDKRIDVLATAIRAGMTAADLSELELAYAPPYSSAKDPVNMIGFVIENILAGRLKQYHFDDICKLPTDGSVTILDGRSRAEYAEGAIKGAINIPVDIIRENIHKLDKNKPVYVYCYSGLRSYIACRILSQNGYDCYNLSGGYGFYEYIIKNKTLENETRFDCGIKK